MRSGSDGKRVPTFSARSATRELRMAPWAQFAVIDS
jgi:hypothetical protein